MTPFTAGALIGQTLGDYELLSLLGAGGMAEVYRARDVVLGREVAVKVLPASLATDPGYVERFRDEARRVAALDHPNVVPVYHYGEEHGLLYLVMPILTESLRDRMVREGILPPSEAGRIAVQVAAALDTAHQHGIVHRDVKPENILLTAESKAQLTDFGIAREVEFLRQTGQWRTLSATGLPVGTPEYMAPEQLRGGIVDQRADIYALGVVLYELLTGTVPFAGPTPYEVAALVLTALLAPPSTRNDAIWPDLDNVVMKALERDADGRYPDVRSMAIALRDAVLHRDDKMTRVTIPASSYLKHVVAAQGPVLPLPTSGPLKGPAAVSIAPMLTLPTRGTGATGATGATGDRTAESTAPFAVAGEKGNARWARSRLLPRRRTWLFVAASVLLVVLFIGTGWSLGIVQGLLSSTGATNLPGLGGLLASNTPTATTHPHSTVTATNGTPGVEGKTTSGTTPTPQATATLPLGSTATPTAPSQPTATHLPPSPLTFDSTTITQSNSSGNTCTGTQSVTNNTATQLSWAWQGSKPGTIGGFQFTLIRANGSISKGGWPVKDTAMLASSSDTVSISADCFSQPQTFSVTVQNMTSGETYNLTLVIQ